MLSTKEKNGKYGAAPECKKCACLIAKDYRKQNKKKISDKRKARYEKNRECILSRNKKYREENKEKVGLTVKKYRESNKDKISKQRKEYYKANLKRLSKANKKYRKENKDRISKQRKSHYESNKERIAERDKLYKKENRAKITKRQNEWSRKRLKTDPIFKASRSLRSQTRRLGNQKSDKSINIIGCSPKEFWKMNGSPSIEEMKTLHIDHIVPLSWFDLSNKKHVIVSTHYTNLQYLSPEDNLLKKDAYAGSPDRIIGYKEGFDIESYVEKMINKIKDQ
jgi:hypothetical protein